MAFAMKSCVFVAAPVISRVLGYGCCIQQATRRAGAPLMSTCADYTGNYCK